MSRRRFPRVALLFAACYCTHPASSSVDLGGGVVTQTNVEQWADLALDVREMREHLNKGEVEQARQIYTKGQFAFPTSLQSLSVDMEDSMQPNYLYQLYGLADRDIYSFRNDAQYGDSFVELALSLDGRPELAPTASLVLLEWMYSTQLLYKGIDKCYKRSVADNMGLLEELGGGGMDEFIALWIGRNQTSGSSDGHGLYAWTQEAGKLFQKTDPEAQVNTQLKLLYHQGTAALSVANACTKHDANTVQQLWTVVQRMVSQMMIPLMQMLIYSLIEKDSAFKLYALAIVPQTSQCRPSVYQRLKEELLDKSFVFKRVPEVLEDLRLVFDCLGFTCGDIGEYKEWQCIDDSSDNKFPLAEYTPTTSVLAQSRIDLDILQLGILTSLGSDQYARFLYLYGRNSPNDRDSENDPYFVTSLHQLATSAKRQRAEPFYSDFARYHNHVSYSDQVVLHVLDGNGGGEFGSTEQRAQVVVKTCAFQILYMYALGEMAGVLQDCKNNNIQDRALDVVAAYLIGSLEGSSSDLGDGMLFWNLAKKRAFQFNTVDSKGNSKVTSELEDMLFASKGALDALDCDNLERTIARIQSLLLIPLIQSTLQYAITNQHLDWTSLDKDLAEGETFALSVLPIVAANDADAAQVLRENMVLTPYVQPVRDGPQQVANILFAALAEVVDCRQVGESPPDITACSAQRTVSIARSSSTGLIVALSTLAVLTLALCLFVWHKFLRKKQDLRDGKLSDPGTVGSTETETILESKSDGEII